MQVSMTADTAEQGKKLHHTWSINEYFVSGFSGLYIVALVIKGVKLKPSIVWIKLSTFMCLNGLKILILKSPHKINLVLEDILFKMFSESESVKSTILV